MAEKQGLSSSAKRVLFDSALFSNLEDKEKQNIVLRLPQPERIEKGEPLFSTTQFRRALLVFLQGSAVVTRQSENGKTVLLRRLGKGDIVGAASLYDEGEYVSDITATSPCTVLFIPATLWTELMKTHFTLAENYIRFLTGRIRFLNGRIATYTESSSDNRLLHYLTSKRQPNGLLALPSFAELSRTLNVGRSSLYRSLDTLQQQGILYKDGKQWYMKET